jgi:hypothetical protein
MIGAIALGILLLGAALGAGLAWTATAARRRPRRQALVRAAAGALAGAVLLHFTVTPAVTGAWVERRARAELLAMPAYPVVQEYEPAAFERVLAEYEQVVRDRSRLPRFTQVVNAELGTLATKHITHASDAALLALMHDMLDKLQVLRARAPEDCYRYLFPNVAGPPDLARWFDHQSMARSLALVGDVIRTAAENPAPVPPREHVEELLGPVINDMYAQFGENTALLSRAAEPGVNRRTVCVISVTLYEKVMRLPPADAAAVIRTMTQL